MIEPGWEILRLGFVVLRDRPMFAAHAKVWRALPEAKIDAMCGLDGYTLLLGDGDLLFSHPDVPVIPAWRTRRRNSMPPIVNP